MKHRIPLCVAGALAALIVVVFPARAEGPGVRCQVAASVLRVRSEPDGGQIGTAYGGTWLTAMGRDAEATWAKVEWSGRDAWVMTQYLECDTPISELNETAGEASDAPTATETTEDDSTATNATSEKAEVEPAVPEVDPLVRVMFQRINGLRAKVNLPPYAWDDRAYVAAQWQAEDMVNRRYFAHNTPDGRTPNDLMRAQGLPCPGWCGQNIIMGQTADEVSYSLNWFMNSTVHRANLLNSRYASIGIGVARARAGVRYYVLNFAPR